MDGSGSLESLALEVREYVAFQVCVAAKARNELHRILGVYSKRCRRKRFESRGRNVWTFVDKHEGDFLNSRLQTDLVCAEHRRDTLIQ